MRRTVKPYQLLDYATHVYYGKYVKRKRLAKTYTAKDRKEFLEIMNAICRHIAQGVIEAPGGVYIRNIGYFFNWMPPLKNAYSLVTKGKKLEDRYNFHTDHYFIFPTFIPMAGVVNPRSSWTMDKQFHYKIKRGCAARVKQGFQYRNYIHTLKILQR
jgi:hypothetical protein